jgi:hypothetical protein
MFIVVNVANALILKFRSQRYIEQRPELAKGYRQLFLGILFFGSLPWLVMGAGIEVGGVSSVFSYLHPSDENPFVLAFLAIVFLWWALGLYWLFASKGAEFLIDHPGFLQRNATNPTRIKLFYCLGIAVGIIALIMASTGHFPPIPK